MLGQGRAEDVSGPLVSRYTNQALYLLLSGQRSFVLVCCFLAPYSD